MYGLIEYKQTEDFVEDVCALIDSAQLSAYRVVDTILVLRNWLLGKRISEEELRGESRAAYGAEIVKGLSQVLTEKYGKGFSKRTLYKCLQFYKTFPDIVPIQSAQSTSEENLPTLSAQLLSWSHYETLLHVYDKDAREWYAKEAREQTWSVRTLRRNISTQYYYRILKSQDKDGVKAEMHQLTSPYQNKLE